MTEALEKAGKDLHEGFDMLCRTDDAFAKYKVDLTVYANSRSREFYFVDEETGKAFEVTVKRAARYDR